MIEDGRGKKSILPPTLKRILKRIRKIAKAQRQKDQLFQCEIRFSQKIIKRTEDSQFCTKM